VYVDDIEPCTRECGVAGTRDDIHREALEFVLASIDRNGYPPTVREIGEAIGYRSPSSAANVVAVMARRGWIVAEPRRCRTMVVTAVGMEAAGRG
jgi:SOS-response transcriptional repressor LexA